MTEFQRGDRVVLQNSIWHVHRASTGLLYVGDQPTHRDSFITFPIQTDGVAAYKLNATFQGHEYECWLWDDFAAQEVSKLEGD